MKKLLCSFLVLIGSLLGGEPRSGNSLWKTLFRSVRSLHRQGILDGEVLITKHNKVVLHLRSPHMKGGKTPLFMIGSESKQFTSVALLKALYAASTATTEEEKTADVAQRLQLPLSSFLGPDDPIWGRSMPSWANTVTLHNLLSMTSGIQDFTGVPAYMEPDPHHKGKLFSECAHSGKEILDLVKDLPLLFTPGSTYSYSNTNYYILSYVIPTITGTPYIPFMTKELFHPLSMRHTSVVRAGRWPQLHKRGAYRSLVWEWNYNRAARSKKLYAPSLYENLNNARGAGSMISTAHDLTAWNKGLYEKGFLPSGLLQLFTTPNLNGYGYGIKITDHPYGKVFQHEGDIDTFHVELLYFQRPHISLVYLSPIRSDGDKLSKIGNTWSTLLKNVIPDPVQRSQQIASTITYEYPELRDGAEKTQGMLQLLFGISPITRD